MNSCRFPYCKELGPKKHRAAYTWICHTAIVTRLHLEVGQSPVAMKYHCQNTRMRDATRSVAANSDNRTRPYTHYVQQRITVSSECTGELSERVYHVNLRSSITCCEGNYNSSDHKFTPMCYTHYDIIFNHVACFTRGLMPLAAGQCNCSHRHQSHASFRKK